MTVDRSKDCWTCGFPSLRMGGHAEWCEGVRAALATAEAVQAATECKRGHPWDEENTYVAPNGERSCRQCQRVRSVQNRDAYNARRRATYAAKKAATSAAPDPSHGPAAVVDGPGTGAVEARAHATTAAQAARGSRPAPRRSARVPDGTSSPAAPSSRLPRVGGGALDHAAPGARRKEG